MRLEILCKHALTLAISLTCHVGLLAPAMADHHPITTPIATLQRLQEAQDKLAKGDANALTAQARLLEELGAQLGHTNPAIFDEAKNFYILMLYLIHGGTLENVNHILERKYPAQVDETLVEAVIAYAQGREGDFHSALGASDTDLNDANWPTSLRASLYLALTPYIIRKDPKLADARLDYVRLIAPGSLYEETALRRQVRLTALLGNEKKLDSLVRNYVERFPHSPYMRDFWTELVEALSLTKNNFSQETIETLLARMPEKLRYPTYLRLARFSLIEGHLKQAEKYAHTAQKLAQAQGLETILPQFYQWAAQAPTVEAGKVKNILQSINLEMLPERDRALAMAVHNIAEAIVAQPDEIDQETASPLPTAKEQQEQDERIEKILQPIQKQIDEIDTLLENGK